MKELVLPLVAFVAAVFANVFYVPKAEYKSKLPVLVPPQGIVHFSFGYHEVVADSLWIRLIQDFTHCGKGVQRTVEHDPKEGPSLEQKVANQGMDFFDALAEEREEKVGCEKGWGYQMLDRITDLSPQFLIAYRVGPSILSVLVGDKKGAAAIFEKGLKQFPNDWKIAYRAAYHYLYEMRDLNRAADMMHLASKNGAPMWASNLAAKMYTRTGQLMLGRVVAMDLLRRSKGKPTIEQKALDQLKKIDYLLAQEKNNESEKK